MEIMQVFFNFYMNEQEKVRAGLSKENEHDIIIIIKS